MKVYKHLPEMLYWKRYFISIATVVALLFFIHDNIFLLVGVLISLVCCAFLIMMFALAEHIMGDSRDLRFFNKMFWYREGPSELTRFGDIRIWCEENLEGKWNYAGSGYFVIKNEIDAMAFRLRWS